MSALNQDEVSSLPSEEENSISFSNGNQQSSEFDSPKNESVKANVSKAFDENFKPDGEISTSNFAIAGNVRVQSAKDHSKRVVQSLIQYNEEMKEYILEWKKGNLTSTADLKDRLEYLVLLKHRVLSQVSDSEIWVQEFLLKPTIKDFLVSVFATKELSQDLKSILQQIISRKDISYICTQNFPEVNEISSSLYKSEHESEMLSITCKKVVCFTSFVTFLNSVLEKEMHSKDHMSSNALASLVSQGLYYLRFPNRNTYNDILTIVLTYPFCKDSAYSSIIAIQQLSITDLEYLISFFSDQQKNLIVYEEKGTVCLQAFLILLAIYVSGDKKSGKTFLKQVYHMMQELPQPLDSSIKTLLNEYLHGGSLQHLTESLHLALVEPCDGRKYHLEAIGSDSTKTGAQQSRLEKIRTSFNTLSLCDDDYIVSNKNPEVHEVLEQLGLCRHYPKKLKVEDALCIRPESLELSLNLKDMTDIKQLPYLILHKLMSYDCLCRTDLISLAQKNKRNLNIDSDSDEFTDSSDSEHDGSSNREVDVMFNIHPIDCLLSLLICCDDFLRQDLLSRLAKCQFAIPFIWPEPFSNKLVVPLWAMRSIIKEWKSTDEEGSIVQHTCPIVDYKMPIISFIRIGSHSKTTLSKSKIMNDVISDAHHDYFFHRDCRGGQLRTKLGRGLVDMCWYLPCGNPTDSFPDAITFLNLHGDAKNFPNQFSSLIKISSMCIILLNDDNFEFEDHIMPCLSRAYSLPGGIVFLNSLEKKPKHLKQHFPKSFVVQLSSKSASNKTAAEIKDAIRGRIQSKLGKMQEYKASIEQACYFKEKQFEIDEENEEYRVGFEHAKKLREMIASSGIHKSSIKEHMLPLQGKDFWKAWALSDKEMHRQVDIGKMSIHDYTAKIESKKEGLRNDQLEKVSNLSPVMRTFIDSLMTLGSIKNYSSRNFFLQILKLELNSLSRECISEKQLDYQITRKELSKMQATAQSNEKKELEEDTKKLQEKLETLQEDIINTSFGLEHLFRELGQVYEACLHGKKHSSSTLLNIDYYITHLPRLAAELLIEGYPLELMDGDAAHVPLQWVVAVIKETADLLSNPKVFVMSVLGLQSTGKSTMLNTAFGLQFNVSAGRCTRGAYMQLIKLDEALLTQTKCKYILVVDTEGLRAPELDPKKTQKHDNELATFVIGLANMTLINIYGEVPGDMDDILQTSVHAFLRMSQVKYYPSCQFIHQNAGVNIKGEVGRAKFTQKLDQFTTDAAREEHCERKFKNFNDVIKFNDQTDVFYFPGLWKGDPPMAPVNEGYSQTAQYLKYQLVHTITERAGLVPSTEKMIGNLDFSSFHVKIQDLWKTLLREKFVFSF